MKLIADPRWTAQVLGELCADPRTIPMVRHYRNVAVAERSACEPADEAAYDALLARIDAALEGAK